ncbi:hypothetical protein [Agaribacter flavus]|uniref:Uncharacterized protein n=1 Tax=Agaribacter flavus TaxID=1902781 RepID=A0ABV7FNZ5_9ALTE
MTDHFNIDPELLSLLRTNPENHYSVVISCEESPLALKKTLTALGIVINGEVTEFQLLYAKLAYNQLSLIHKCNGIEWVEADTSVHTNLDV